VEAAGVELDTILKTGLFLHFPRKNHPPESADPLKNAVDSQIAPTNVELWTVKNSMKRQI
jgi:hypothetical protein